jgi:hypothetical protein
MPKWDLMQWASISKWLWSALVDTQKYLFKTRRDLSITSQCAIFGLN